jgi:hypothetical protein
MSSSFISEQYFSSRTVILPRKNKRLIVCPKCMTKGIKEVLGEINDDGSITVQRFHKGMTRIFSSRYAIQCTCGEVVFKNLKGSGDNSDLW